MDADGRHLEALFLSVTECSGSPEDTARRQEAEQLIQAFARQEESIVGMMAMLQFSEHAGVRQLAAIVLRRVVLSHWRKIPASYRQSLGPALLDLLAREPQRLVRNSIIATVEKLASLLLPAEQWPDLPRFLLQMGASPHAHHRECAILTLAHIGESGAGKFLRPHFEEIHQLFLAGMRDGPLAVTVTSLHALAAFVSYQETAADAAAYGAMIPAAVDAIKRCLESGQEEEAMRAFEIFDEEEAIPDASLPLIVGFMRDVAAAGTLSSHLRQRAAEFLLFASQTKGRAIRKSGLLEAVVNAGLLLAVVPETEEEHADEFEISCHKTGCRLLDVVGRVMPNRAVAPLVMPHLARMFRSEAPSERKGAVMVLGVLAEGMNRFLRPQIAEILEWTLPMLGDADLNVRISACLTLGQFGEHLQPEIGQHHEMVLPPLLATLDDPTPRLQEVAAYALETFLEDLGEAVTPYAAALIERLMRLLETATNREIQEMAVAAVSSVVVSARSAFTPLHVPVLTRMAMLMDATGHADLLLRARATECVGVAAVAIGRDLFRPHLARFMAQALAGLELDYVELREYTYNFFSNVTEAFGDDPHFLGQYLPSMMAAVIASCATEEGIEPIGVEASGSAHLDLGSDDEDDDDDDVAIFSVRTAVIDEKVSAVVAVGRIALHAGRAFGQWLPHALRSLLHALKFAHESVRAKAATSLGQILFTTAAIGGPPVTGTAQVAVPALVELVLADKDMDVVSCACQSLSEGIEALGRAGLPETPDSLCAGMVKILNGDAECQRYYDDEGDHDPVLIDEACDLVTKIAKAIGPETFPRYFAAMVAPLLRFCGDNRPDLDRSMAVGTIADVASTLGPAFLPFVQYTWPAVHRLLADEFEEAQCNAAFACGVLVSVAGPTAAELVAAAIPPASALLSPDHSDRTRDNAAGALARMILTVPEATNVLLPLLLEALPLRSDMEENEPCFHAIRASFAERWDLSVPHLASAVRAAGVSLVRGLDDSAAAHVSGFLRATFARDGGATLQQALAAAGVDRAIAEQMLREASSVG